jgi:ParB family chromosome partitioning protein
MAKEAERLLEGTGWLPEPLRLTDRSDVPNTPIDTVEALPAFLADDQARDPVTEASDQHPIAAE